MIAGRHARTVRYAPMRLTSTTFSNAPGGSVRTMPPTAMPALASTASRPPRRSTVPDTAVSSASESVMSASNHAVSGPQSAATRSSSSGSKPTSERRAPRAAAKRAVAAPMPRAAPVMRTTLPLSDSSAAMRRGPYRPVRPRGIVRRYAAAVPALVSIEARGDVALVRVDRPPANAMDRELLAEAVAACEQLAAGEAAAVVITGREGFFSAGVDLKLAPTLDAEAQRAMVDGINRMAA